MKKSKAFLVLFILLGVAPFTFSAIAQNADVEKMHQLYINSINSGNSNNIEALYTQDASIRNSDGSMTEGLENIKAQYMATFAAGKYNITLKTIDVSLLDKDYMFVSGAYVYKKLDEPKMVLKGTFVNTLKKVKGNWKIYKSYRYSETTNNAKIVDGLYKAFAAGNIPDVLGAMDANIVWNEAEGNALAVGNPYLGPDAVLNGVFAKIPVDFDNFQLSDIKLNEMSNDQVLATLRYNATSKHNGQKLDAQAAHLWTVKDGKIIGFQQYADTKQLDEMLKM